MTKDTHNMDKIAYRQEIKRLKSDCADLAGELAEALAQKRDLMAVLGQVVADCNDLDCINNQRLFIDRMESNRVDAEAAIVRAGGRRPRPQRSRPQPPTLSRRARRGIPVSVESLLERMGNENS